MADMVMDACVLIAFLRDEDGAENIEQMFNDADFSGDNMPISALTLTIACAITEAVFGYALAESGLAETLRSKLGRNPTKLAYKQGLARAIIAKTRAKQDRLLLAFEQPDAPLHNNPAELAVRQRVRKRRISFGPRSDDGVTAWDTFATLGETAKKLGVNFYDNIYDRISSTHRLPSLASIIKQRSVSDPHATASGW